MHRVSRIASISLLIVGVAAAVALLAWSIYTRDNIDEVHPSIKGGLTAVVVLAGTKFLVVLGAAIAAGSALIVAWLRRAAWAAPATALLGGVMIAGVWFARTVIVHMEDPRYRAKSPWVQAATWVAILATAYFVLVTIAAVIAWRSRPRTT